MMTYKLTPSLNDGKNDPPPIEIRVKDLYELLDHIAGEMANDYDEPFGVGFTLTIERIK